MKITFFETRDDEKNIYSTGLSMHELTFVDTALSSSNIAQAKDAECIVVFVNSKITREYIDMMPQVKLIATRSTGFDHIDTQYCKEKGVAVATVPAYGAETVAEFTFALILAISRKVVHASMELKTGIHMVPLEGFDLHGKTIGIVGTGRIGKHVASIAKGFGMHIVLYDLYPDTTFAELTGASYVPLEVLYARSDIITLHAPATKENHHMVDSAAIAQMKDGVCIINTARGELIDTQALIAGLSSGKIAAAGLDVFEGEGDVKRGTLPETVMELRSMNNVLITPHTAFCTKEAKERIEQTTIESIIGFSAGAPINLI